MRIADPTLLFLRTGLANARLSSMSRPTLTISIEVVANGSVVYSVTDSSTPLGTNDLRSTPVESSHANRPSLPKRSNIAVCPTDDTSPMTRIPKRARAAFSWSDTGRVSMDMGARKWPTSSGALTTLTGSAVRAAA